MKKQLLDFLLLMILIFSPAQLFAGDAFIDRDGRTFVVSIDENVTMRIPPRDIRDSTTVVPYTATWSAQVGRGPRCFRITPKDKRLGEPERIDVLIHEVQPDKPFNSWRNYIAVPSTLENTNSFLSGDGFCVTEYTLTERLRFSSLPAGEYLVLISFWGKGNWDRQTILMKVAQSPEQPAESEPSAAAAVEPPVTEECSLVYAARRTMALHQQLEDKVATGELNQDVFSSFGKDTEDFGTLYSTNLPEACRRLEKIRNKYRLK